MLPPYTLTDASGHRVKGSKSQRCVTPMNGRPDITFPTVGRLGLTSPPTSQSPDLRYYVMLRLPKARLASFGCPYVHDTLHGFRFVSCCQLVKGVWKPSFHARRFPQGDGSPKPSYCKETVGSPRVPRLSLCTHALLSDPILLT